MQDRLRSIGSTIAARSTAVLAAVLAITILLGIGLAQLDFATGQSSLLDPDSDLGARNTTYQELFGGENMVVLFTADEGSTVADLFTADNLAQFAEIEEQLRGSDDVFGVVSPVTALSFTENLVASGTASQILDAATARETDPERIELRQTSDQITSIRAIEAGEQSLDNPAWVKFLLFENIGFELVDGSVVAPPDDELEIRRSLRGFIPNSTNALLAAVLPGNADLDTLAVGQAQVEDVMAGRNFDNATVTITGTPTFLADINDYLRGGMLVLGGLALLLMTIALFVAFDVRWRLLPLGVVVVGIAWTFGILGLIGIDLSLVTISGLPILIGIGIDFAIQMHSRAEEEMGVDHDPAPFAETFQRLVPALATATLAAVLAFLVLRISDVPMIRDFGAMLAIGMACLLVAGSIIPTAVLGLRERRGATEPKPTGGRIERLVVGLGAAPTAVAIPLLLLAVVVPIVGLSLESGFTIESDPINWTDQDSDTVRNARFLEDETNFASSFGVIIQTDADGNGIFTDEHAAFTHDLAFSELEQHPELAEASSLVTTLSYLIAIPGTTPFPPTGADLLAAYDQAPSDIQNLLVADDGNAAQLNFRVAPSALEDRSAVFADIDDTIAAPEDRAPLPEGTTAAPAGLATVGTGLLDNLTESRAAFTYLSLLAAGAWLLFRLRNVARAALSLVPVLIAIGGSAMIVAALSITLSPLTTVSGPLIVATCAEFTILIMSRYIEERDTGATARAATDHAAARTGKAFFASALTTVGGFGVLMLSPLPLLRDFGAIVTLNVVVALLSALVVLPPLIVWADERGLLGYPGTDGAERPSPSIGRPLAIGMAAVLAVVGIALTASSTSTDVETQPIAFGPAGVIATEATGAGGGGDAAAEDLRPEGLVASGLYDAYLEAGAFPEEARCLADEVLAQKTQTEMIQLGIAQTPPAEEAAAVVAAAADVCEIPQEVSDVVAGVPGAEVPDRSDEAPSAGADVERPTGLIEAGLFDAYLAGGATPEQAICIGEVALTNNTQSELLGMGIAQTPPAEEAAAAIAEAANECGIPDEVSDAVANANS